MLAGGEALEVDMLGHVGDGVELHLAHQGAMALPAELELEETRPPATLLQLLEDCAGLERNQGGLCLCPIDNRRHLACAPCRTRRPLTGSRTRLGLDRDVIGHCRCSNRKRRPPGVPAKRAGVAGGGREGKGKAGGTEPVPPDPPSVFWACGAASLGGVDEAFRGTARCVPSPSTRLAGRNAPVAVRRTVR